VANTGDTGGSTEVANSYEGLRRLSESHARLQTLMHHVNRDNLIAEHRAQVTGKAVGTDGVTKESYDVNLEENIDTLLRRMKSFSYRPQAVRRTYIPKANGGVRPLGIPAYEDKLVQGVMAKVLTEVYETRFLDLSYGFRPNRSCHDVIREINQTIMTKKVNYILDADIKGFFDNVDHRWLVKFLEHDIQDKSFIRYVVRFLKAGIIEDDRFSKSEKGTPQGGLISPVLANVYLHYVLDLWFAKVMRKRMKGEAYMYRYADDFIVMFQYENDARMFFEALVERLAKFSLSVAEDKTRIIPFGRFKGTKETFDFLGFTHINAVTRTGKYTVLHRTSKKKLKDKRASVKQWIRWNMHRPIQQIISTLSRTLIGHYNYYGVNGNLKGLYQYYKYIRDILFKTLRRRSQKRKMNWEIFGKIWEAIPRPRICKDIWQWSNV
jgi:RNA-directed DNA polymerase